MPKQVTTHILWSLVICGVLALGGLTQRLTRPAPEAAQTLLKLRDYEFNTESFLEAVRATDQLAVNAFLEAGMDVNASNEVDGQTALILASSRGDAETVRTLLQRRADPNLKDKGGFTALFRALQNRYEAIADLLLAQPRLDLNARGLNGVTALIAYVSRDRTDIVSNLLGRGADVNLRDADGDTALHMAAQVGNLQLIQMLLAKGANVNAKNKVGGTPLMWAAVYGNETVARALLDHRADASAKDEDGITAAGWAAKNRREGLLRLLGEPEKSHSRVVRRRLSLARPRPWSVFAARLGWPSDSSCGSFLTGDN